MLGKVVCVVLLENPDFNAHFSFVDGYTPFPNIRTFVNLELVDISHGDKIVVLSGTERGKDNNLVENREKTAYDLARVIEAYPDYDIHFSFVDGYSRFPNVRVFNNFELADIGYSSKTLVFEGDAY